MTNDTEVQEFRGEQIEEYDRFLTGRGYVLNILSDDYGKVHDTRCSHIQVYPNDKTVGHDKACARRMPPLRAWAREHGVEFDWCDSCQL